MSTLEKLLAEVTKLREILEEDKSKESDARKATTFTTNLYNEKTQEIDACLLELKRESPRGTNWYDEGLSP